MDTSPPRVLRFVSYPIVLVLLLFGALHAQNPVEDAIKELSSDNVKGYVQPFVNSFGANLNSGLYSTAQIGETGFAFRFSLVGMGTLIGDAEKVYRATSPYDGSPVQTATLFGGPGTVVPGPTDSLSGEPIVSYQFPGGQVKTSIVGLAVPQITVGNFAGTQAVIRYVPIPEIGDFPKTTLFGIAARHSISRYLPLVSVDLAGSIAYHSLTVGETFEAKAFSIGAQVSKSQSVATFYGGLQWETSSMDLDYSFRDSRVHVEVDGENHFRATAGIGLSLAIVHLNADISVGKMTVVSAGLGFGL